MGWVCKPWMKMMMMQVSNLVSVPPGGGCTGLLVVVDGVAGEAVEGLSSDRTPYCCCCYWAPPKRGAGTHPNSRLVERCPGWPQGGGNNRSFNNSSYHIMFMFIYKGAELQTQWWLCFGFFGTFGGIPYTCVCVYVYGNRECSLYNKLGFGVWLTNPFLSF